MNRCLMVAAAGLVAVSAFFGVHVGHASPKAIEAEQVNTRTVAMPFAECLSILDEVSLGMGIEPVKLVNTDDLRMIRVDAADGFVTVSCSRPDNRMTLAKMERSTRSSQRIVR